MVKTDPHGPGGLAARVLLLLGAVLFPLGLILPMIETQSFLVFREHYSLLQSIAALIETQDYVLAGVIGVFSILFPILKVLSLAFLNMAAPKNLSSGTLKFLEALGKWSMMDVLLVALVVFSAKTSGLAEASALPGLWFYGTATTASVLASVMIKK